MVWSPDKKSGRYEPDQRSFDMRNIKSATRTTKFVVAAVVAQVDERGRIRGGLGRVAHAWPV